MSKSIPQVLVACAWYNRADYIDDTVNSLLSQDFEDFEIVIVNDGSTDPSVKAILDTYCDPRLRIIHQENTGFVGAIRRAITSSQAPFIAIQGAGDISYSSRLFRQAEFLSKNPSYTGVGCVLRERVVGGSQDGLTFLSRTGDSVVKTQDFLQGGAPVSHGSVMFRRTHYDNVGGYRDYFKFSQDRDLWLRMSKHGPFYIINEELYQRNQFYSDGVVSSVEKRLLQSILSHFARQCHYDREAMGYDWIDRYGSQAGLMRSPSKGVALALVKYALIKLFHGDLKEADRASIMAVQEKKFALSLAARLAIFAAQRSATAHKIGCKLLSRLKSVERMRNA